MSGKEKKTQTLKAAFQGSIYFGRNEYWEWWSGTGTGQAEMQLGRTSRDEGAQS